ncbi:hypothetical protein AB2B38_010265 [Balneola sp. MJW-20]|uniref:hypothetical protein n=1 Tax=Gracilimonas aurantiaca TaxID=3234185 RepID=UPI003466843C
MRIFGYALALLFLFTGCINNEESEGPWEEIRPETFEVSAQQGNALTIRITQSCGSACWGALEDRISKDGNVYSITTLARIISEVCTLQCVAYSREYEIELPAPGQYTFRYVLADTTADEFTFELN